jgi:DNA-binding Xre family transcriptional regulator
MRISKQVIQVHMAEKKMTMTALATASGMSRQQLSVIIAKGVCTPASAGRIAEGLGVTVMDIVEEGG